MHSNYNLDFVTEVCFKKGYEVLFNFFSSTLINKLLIFSYVTETKQMFVKVCPNLEPQTL